MNKILAFGELLWDILPDKTILGGAPFNFSCRVNSLGDAGLFASSIGVDELGEQAFQQVQALGVKTSLLQRNLEYLTGTVNVSFDHNRLPDYVINPAVAYDHIELTDELLKAAAQTDCLCFGTLIQRAETSRQTLHALVDAASNAVRFLDINLRKKCYSKDTVLYSLTQANILKLNDDEAMQLRELLGLTFESFPAFCRLIIKEFSLDYVLVTFGKFGAYAQSSFGEDVYVPGYKTELADSLGAGDAFSAAFVHHILRGHSLKVACDNSNALGALVATTHGATAVISQNEITALLHSNTDRLYHPTFS